MADEPRFNFYDVLQINVNAEPETIHRVYRLLAQRFHPDNQETGDPDRFRLIREAYTVLSDPEKRRQHDLFQVWHVNRARRSNPSAWR